MPTVREQVRELIATGEIEKSLSLLRQYSNDDQQNEIIIFQSRFAQMQKEEHLTGENKSNERLRLCKAILEWVNKASESKFAINSSNDPLFSKRKEKLKKKIADTYTLIEQWEEKLQVSENPTEQKRCTMEIARLQDIVSQYIKELNQS